MKTNLPVTQNEVLVPQGSYLVSQTDLKGVITDANEAFVAISGFRRDELMGQSHNIVRHPDMPAVAFADMWASLKAGLPWRGVVKNRAKTGDFYWVDAQIVPILKQGQVTGYMSVRRAPTRVQINEAEALYGQLRISGKFNSIKRNPMSVETLVFGTLGITVLLLAINLLSLLVEFPGWLEKTTAFLAMLSILPLFFFLHGSVFKPLAEIRANIAQLTEGDLAHRYPICKPNEIGQIANAFSIMQTQWLVSIDHIKVAIRDSMQSMREVNQQSDTINKHINSQHDRVATVAAATEEFCQSVAEVAGSAAETSRAASKSEQLVQQSQETVQSGMAAAESVVGAVKASHATISELDNAVGKIGDITQVIKEIADQTNLLALNAAIEAARAGESGRGFAVVADEVRKLAERTAGSTQEINQMVSGVQQLADEVVSAMSQAAQAVETSSSKMHDSVDGLNLVASASLQTVSMAEHIASASDQQSLAGQEVARNMEAISSLSEDSQAQLQQLWKSMETLRVATKDIEESVEVFKLFQR